LRVADSLRIFLLLQLGWKISKWMMTICCRCVTSCSIFKKTVTRQTLLMNGLRKTMNGLNLLPVKLVPRSGLKPVALGSPRSILSFGDVEGGFSVVHSEVPQPISTGHEAAMCITWQPE